MAGAADIIGGKDHRLRPSFGIVVLHQFQGEFCAGYIDKGNGDISIGRLIHKSSRLEKAFISPVRQTVVGLHPQQIAVIVHSLLHVIYKNTDVRQADNVRQFGPDHARFVVTHLLCPLIQWSEHW